MKPTELLGGLALLALAWPLRSVLVPLEPVLPPLLFWTGLAAAGLRLWLGRRGPAARRWRRVERSLARTLERWGWAAAILLFLLPLWSQWALRPPGHASAVAALAGRLPWFDAAGHFEGANRLLAEGELNGFSERRPPAAALLSVMLAATGGRLPAALTVQCALAGIAAFLAARAVGLRFGVFPALSFFGLVLGLLRDTLGAVLTEPMGAALACLAVAIFATARARTSLAALALGFLCLDASLRARPGAQLLLPCLAAWALVVQRGRRLWTAAMLALVVGVGALHMASLDALYGSGQASSTSYPAFTLYGLAHDGNYELAYRDFAPELARLPEREVARLVYRKALERLAQDPASALRALARNGRDLRKLFGNLAHAVSPRAVLAPRDRLLRPTAWDVRFDRLCGGLALLLAAAGLVARLRHAPGEERLFWLAVVAGIAGSACFVLGDSATRVLVAGFPLIAFGLASGLALRRRLLPSPRRDAQERGIVAVAAGLGLALLLVCLLGPAIAHRLSPRPAPSALRGLDPARVAVSRLEACPSVVVTGPGEGLSRRRFARQLELAGIDDLLAPVTTPPPLALLSCYDHVSRRQRLLVGPPELAHARGFAELQLETLASGTHLVAVKSWRPL